MTRPWERCRLHLPRSPNWLHRHRCLLARGQEQSGCLLDESFPPARSRGKGLAVLLGELGVDKTCLGMRLRGEKISPHGPSPTLGEGAVSEVRVSYPVKFQLRDTAGQEIYRSLGQNYVRGAHLIIVCYSLTVAVSMQRVSEHADYAYQTCPSPPTVFLVRQGRS
jgi:hypothetical protein